MENNIKKTTRRLSAGGVVVNQKGEVLVVNQNGDSWSLPKGGIEGGEAIFSHHQKKKVVSSLTHQKDKAFFLSIIGEI